MKLSDWLSGTYGGCCLYLWMIMCLSVMFLFVFWWLIFDWFFIFQQSVPSHRHYFCFILMIHSLLLVIQPLECLILTSVTISVMFLFVFWLIFDWFFIFQWSVPSSCRYFCVRLIIHLLHLVIQPWEFLILTSVTITTLVPPLIMLFLCFGYNPLTSFLFPFSNSSFLFTYSLFLLINLLDFSFNQFILSIWFLYPPHLYFWCPIHQERLSGFWNKSVVLIPMNDVFWIGGKLTKHVPSFI